MFSFDLIYLICLLFSLFGFHCIAKMHVGSLWEFKLSRYVWIFLWTLFCSIVIWITSWLKLRVQYHKWIIDKKSVYMYVIQESKNNKEVHTYFLIFFYTYIFIWSNMIHIFCIFDFFYFGVFIKWYANIFFNKIYFLFFIFKII